MATRCNILVSKTQAFPDVNGRPNPNNGKRFGQYYRHWDGYPAGTGLDLALKLMQLTENAGPDELDSLHGIESELRSILTLDYEHESHGENSLHGDIEWLYVIDCDNGITLTAYDIGIGNDPDAFESRPKQTLLRIGTTEYNGKRFWQFIRLSVGA